MNNYEIVEVNKKNIHLAQELVNTVFPYQSPAERVSLWIFERREKFWGKLLYYISGAQFINYWIALSEQGKALGISGLYKTRKDRHEALWLGWYGVRQEARGKKIGGVMLKHAISQASLLGATYLRLYTTDSELISGASDAQKVYDHYGFKIKSSRRIFGGLIINKEGIKMPKAHYIIREKILT